MERHLSRAIARSSDRVAKLKKVMVNPKYWQTAPVSLIPIMVVLIDYDVSTRGPTRHVPVRSVMTSVVTSKRNRESRCLLFSFLRRISRSTSAIMLPITPAENMIALMSGLPGSTVSLW